MKQRTDFSFYRKAVARSERTSHCEVEEVSFLLLKERDLFDETAALSFESGLRGRVTASTKCTQCASPLIARTEGRVMGDPRTAQAHSAATQATTSFSA
jgi:hypothetical protein